MSGHIEYYGGAGAGSGMLPAGGSGMSGMEDNMQGIQMQPGRPMSVCSVSSCGAGGPSPVHRSGSGLYSNCASNNPQEELMNDELLMSLSVRELNKRLHGCPREEVSQVSYFFNDTYAYVGNTSLAFTAAVRFDLSRCLSLLLLLLLFLPISIVFVCSFCYCYSQFQLASFYRCLDVATF